MEQINKKVKMNLAGLDGNAFFIMGAFQSKARKQGWTQEEINNVLKECQSGDYNYLLQTIIKYTDGDE